MAPDASAEPAPAHTSDLRALLLTDVVDSTQLSQALGDERMAAPLGITPDAFMALVGDAEVKAALIASTDPRNGS